MNGFRGPEVVQPPSGSSKSNKRFAKRIRNKTSTLFDNVSNTLRRASRQILSTRSGIPTELCPDCVEYVLNRSEDPVHDIRLVTSLSLSPGGLCPQQEFHVAEMLCMMGGLYHLELLDIRTTPDFYALLAERAQFRLECFVCESPLFDTLLWFLSTQRHLREFTHLAGSLATHTATRVRGPQVLDTVQTLSATAPLLLHPQLDPSSLRHLEYMGGGQGLGEEVRAIEKIYQLGPQLRSLRFMWGAGRTETFLDVTKFFCIAKNTSSIKYIYLSDVSRNASDFPRTYSMFAFNERESVPDI